jgi:cobalamin biosynthesis protein CobT
LAHEAAHVRYTDFAVYEQAAREGPLQVLLQNRLEDVRIERALARPYPGTKATIATVLRRMLAEGRMSAPEPGDHPAQVLAAYLLLALRHEVLGQDVLAAEANKAAETLRRVFPAAFISRLRILMDEVPGLTTTAETVDLARRIHRLIEDEADQPSGNGSGGTGDPEDEGDTEQESGTNTVQDEDGYSQEETATQPGTNVGDEGEKASPDAPESASNENQDGGSAGSETQPDNGSETDSPHEVGANTKAQRDCGEDVGGSDQRDALAAVLAAGAGDCDGDLFTEVGKLLGTEASATNMVRLPLPEDYPGNALAGMRLLARVQTESARLSARLQGLVQASRMDRPRPVKRGRRLDPRRLHRVAVADERIFARRARRVAPNTAVHLLVDLSGSMHAIVHRRDGSPTSRASSALESALALALALDGIPGVTLTVTAFPGQAGQPDRVTRMVRHGQSPRACAGAFIQTARGGTPMAQALWYAAAELLACREQRRLVMVLTDGAPDDATEVLRLLALCRQAGIETVGVGIGIDIGHLFPTALEVTQATDLKRELFGVAERLLVAAAA